MEICGQHADDGVRLAPQRYGLPDDRGVAVETALPKRVTQHGYGWTARVVFVRQELASNEWNDTQYTEEAGRYALLLDIADLAACHEIDAHRLIAVHGPVNVDGIVPDRFPNAARQVGLVPRVAFVL